MTKRTLEWTDDLLTGDTEIDTHHRALFHKALRISVACELGRGDREVGKTIAFLADYTQHHFAAEEKRMKLVNYPYMETHRGEHTEFMSQLAQYDREFRESTDKRSVALAVADFVARWFTRHVKLVDRPLIEYLRGQRR